jgi:hypothetical protein
MTITATTLTRAEPRVLARWAAARSPRPRSADAFVLTRPPEPADHELRIGGHIDGPWSTRFDEMTLFREDGGATTLHGSVADQAPLLGLLATVPDLGNASISLEVTDAPH